MSLFAWIFWGFIALVIILAFVLRKKEAGTTEQSKNQLEREKEARRIERDNIGGGPGGGFGL